MASTSSPGSLSSFADAQHLSAGTGGDLPRVGGLLGRSDLVVDVPESMGYAPYLQMGSGFGLSAGIAGIKSLETAPTPAA